MVSRRLLCLFYASGTMPHMETLTTRTLADVEDFARKCMGSFVRGNAATVIALTGDLGVGKTTFVQACARTLGLTAIVTSPTFVVMKRYELRDARFSTLIHIDAYRIEDEQELEVLKLRESLTHSENIIMIEWAERIPNFIPSPTLHIAMTLNTDGSREIRYGTHTIHAIHSAHDTYDKK